MFYTLCLRFKQMLQCIRRQDQMSEQQEGKIQIVVTMTNMFKNR